GGHRGRAGAGEALRVAVVVRLLVVGDGGVQRVGGGGVLGVVDVHHGGLLDDLVAALPADGAGEPLELAHRLLLRVGVAQGRGARRGRLEDERALGVGAGAVHHLAVRALAGLVQHRGDLVVRGLRHPGERAGGVHRLAAAEHALLPEDGLGLGRSDPVHQRVDDRRGEARRRLLVAGGVLVERVAGGLGAVRVDGGGEGPRGRRRRRRDRVRPRRGLGRRGGLGRRRRLRRRGGLRRRRRLVRRRGDRRRRGGWSGIE